MSDDRLQTSTRRRSPMKEPRWGRLKDLYSRRRRCSYIKDEELEHPTGTDHPIQGSPTLQPPQRPAEGKGNQQRRHRRLRVTRSLFDRISRESPGKNCSVHPLLSSTSSSSSPSNFSAPLPALVPSSLQMPYSGGGMSNMTQSDSPVSCRIVLSFLNSCRYNCHRSQTQLPRGYTLKKLLVEIVSLLRLILHAG
jgi:hypothetical protein